VVEPIPLGAFSIAATGIPRPEDIAIGPTGRVFVSDASAAVSELRPDGSIVRIGKAGGEPTGINLLPDGSMVIGNFASGVLQRLDLDSGDVDVLADEVGGERLTAVNYPLVGKDGVVWVSCSARQDPAVAMATGADDGYIFRLSPEGTTKLVADRLPFPNCMTFDAEGRAIYVVRSTVSDVVRMEVIDNERLGPPERYGPPLGDRRAEEYGPEQLESFGRPEVLARWALADGCAFDAEGNLWVTLMSANRIVAITPDLDVVPIVEDPEGSVIFAPSSVVWGGTDRRDLYVGSLFSDRVAKARSPIPGMRSPYEV
jgi:sugar lactone lactonase YvrE